MNTDKRLEILVSHDSPLVCAGLAATLREHADLAVTVADPQQRDPWNRTRCDVLVADYAAGTRCLDALAMTTPPDREPAPKVLIVTTQHGEWEIRSALGRGVQGYLLLGCPAEKLVQGVRLLARGSRCYDDAVMHRMADSLVRAALTNREHDVLQLVVQGAGNKQIASSLDIQLGTVKAHVKSILEKLQVRTRTQAAVIAEYRGLLRAQPRFDEVPMPMPLALARVRAKAVSTVGSY